MTLKKTTFGFSFNVTLSKTRVTKMRKIRIMKRHIMYTYNRCHTQMN